MARANAEDPLRDARAFCKSQPDAEFGRQYFDPDLNGDGRPDLLMTPALGTSDDANNQRRVLLADGSE